MKILVTGSSGFIGRHFVALLGKTDHEVLSLGRSADTAASASFVACDLHQISAEARARVLAFAPDACVHLAWQGIPDYSPEICRRNFESSINLFQLAIDAGCKKILGAGSCWEYGELRGSVEENQQARELGIFAAYKTSARLVLESLCRGRGIQGIWARIFFVYGDGQRSEALIPSTIKKVLAKQPIEIRNPNAQNDFIYVGDVVRALLALLESPAAAGPYNVGSGKPLSVGAVVKEVEEVLGVPGGYSFLPEDRPGDSFWADISRISSQTGWKPQVAIAEGIKRASAAGI